jgi:RNA polymerase sigma-70 factor (ECF subfamily)
LSLITLEIGMLVALAYPAVTTVSGPSPALLRGGNIVNSRSGEDSGTFGDARRRFVRLVLPHLPAAYGLARSLTRNPSDAEDVVQEACLRAYRALDSTPVGNGRAWLLKIVHNTAYTWLRKNRSTAIIAVDNLEAAERVQAGSFAVNKDTPEAAVIAKTDGTLLEAAIAGLPALFQEVLVLREIEGLSYSEIAEVTAVPVGTVMSRLARARERLIAAVGRGAR